MLWAAGCPGSTRCTIPSMDWFCRVKPLLPTKSPNQKSWAADGSAMKPATTVTTNVSTATSPARIRCEASRNGMKTSGVSFIPAAMPMPMPFHRHESGRARSAIPTTSRIRLIWPKYIVM